ncbi:unnamed protein product [Peniophora sp. CBMAI 1063]|nr:unnamed protein product [Peniophora sp. CBMAI 1063]
MLGLGIPLLVAGPLYYVVQGLRFQVLEGFGCSNATDGSILHILLIRLWTVIPPLVTITIYYPHVARIFYLHGREVTHFLQSNNSVNRTHYFRILALASIDILLTLPIGIANIVLSVEDEVARIGPIPFYFGWTYDHTGWQPQSYSYAAVVSEGTFVVAQEYFVQWTSPALAFAIFALFGITAEARASYWRTICTIGGWFGWNTTPPRGHSPLEDIEFGERPPQNSMSLGLESNASYIDPNARAQDQVVGGGGARNDTESGSEKDDDEEARRPQEIGRRSDAERRTQPPGGSHEASRGDASALV